MVTHELTGGLPALALPLDVVVVEEGFGEASFDFGSSLTQVALSSAPVTGSFFAFWYATTALRSDVPNTFVRFAAGIFSSACAFATSAVREPVHATLCVLLGGAGRFLAQGTGFGFVYRRAG